MAVRKPVIYGSGFVRPFTNQQITKVRNEAARLYGLDPSVTLQVSDNAGANSIGALSDTRLIAGLGVSGTTDFPTQELTPDVSAITVTKNPIGLHYNTSDSIWASSIYSYPLYYDNGNLRVMTVADFADTFIKPAIDNITSSSSSAGTYFVSSSSSVSGASLVSSTPIFTDTRHGSLPSETTTAVQYEIIGGGGAGGNGWNNSAAADSGDATTISGSGITTATSPGGGAGVSHALWASTGGQASAYGFGGAAGATSDSNRQTSGGDAPSGSYGAGGGGGGGNPFNAYNSGAGGAAATRVDGSLGQVAIGTVLTIVVGAGGARGTGTATVGGAGAGGYAKITMNAVEYIYDTPGTYTLTVTGDGVPSLFFDQDNPVTIANYYLLRTDASNSPLLDSTDLPLVYRRDSNATNLQIIPAVTFRQILQTMIRYYAAQVAGSKISYNINGSGINMGTLITDTRLDSSLYFTDQSGLDDYRSQEIPDASGTSSTINTYRLKMTKV